MTKEEYYKAQICAQMYRKQVRENHLLRQKLAGTDPASLAQDRQDREAFALVKSKKDRMGKLPTIQFLVEEHTAPERKSTREAAAKTVRQEREYTWEWIASVTFGAITLLMPLVWWLG